MNKPAERLTRERVPIGAIFNRYSITSILYLSMRVVFTHLLYLRMRVSLLFEYYCRGVDNISAIIISSKTLKEVRRENRRRAII